MFDRSRTLHNKNKTPKNIYNNGQNLPHHTTTPKKNLRKPRISRKTLPPKNKPRLTSLQTQHQKLVTLQPKKHNKTSTRRPEIKLLIPPLENIDSSPHTSVRTPRPFIKQKMEHIQPTQTPPPRRFFDLIRYFQMFFAPI